MLVAATAATAATAAAATAAATPTAAAATGVVGGGDGGVNSGLPERGVSIVEVTGAGTVLELQSLSLVSPDVGKYVSLALSLSLSLTLTLSRTLALAPTPTQATPDGSRTLFRDVSLSVAQGDIGRYREI